MHWRDEMFYSENLNVIDSLLNIDRDERKILKFYFKNRVWGC